MPGETRAYIIHLMQGYYGFKALEAWNLMLRRWVDWTKDESELPIPGYKACPPPTLRGLPAGWSLATFQRLAKESRKHSDVIRIVGVSSH